MKITVVPAQVTTVEDRIVGNLGFSQMLLLIVPVFVGAGLFAVLPPAMGSASYKYVIMAIIAFFCALLAIRIRGKILAAWLVTILRYNLRAKYYLFNKNTSAMRDEYTPASVQKPSKTVAKSQKKHSMLPKLDSMEAAQLLAVIENPAAKLRFETTRKGALHVRLTEVEE